MLARDRLGVKPLYYAVRGDLLVSRSELKCLLASGLVGAELDYEAIDAYLTLGFVPAPARRRSPVSQAAAGPPARRRGRQCRLERVLALPAADGPSRGGDVRGVSRTVLDALERSVELRLMSDVPLGAMLTGGLDSSLSSR